MQTSSPHLQPLFYWYLHNSAYLFSPKGSLTLTRTHTPIIGLANERMVTHN